MKYPNIIVNGKKGKHIGFTFKWDGSQGFPVWQFEDGSKMPFTMWQINNDTNITVCK